MTSKAFTQYNNNIRKSPPPGHLKMHGIPVYQENYQFPTAKLPENYEGGEIFIRNIRGYQLSKKGVRQDCIMLYIHGGGFTIGSVMDRIPFLQQFVDKCNIACFGVEYSLAPWHPFPQGLEDCLQFYEGLIDAGNKKIIVGGESAGASLTLSVALALKIRGIPLPAALWCSSPLDDAEWFKKECYTHDFFSDCAEKVLELYAPDADRKNPLLSPIYGNFHGMPPMIIQTGGGESLAAGAVRLAQKAAAANVEVVLHFGKDMPHTFAKDYPYYPEAADALDEIAAFLKRFI